MKNGSNGSPPIEKDLIARLEKRRQAGLHRELKVVVDKADFCSNDYLGFARSERLRHLFEHAFSEYKGSIGASGARLISGENPLFAALESELATFHDSDSALIFNSGYDANLGLFSCIADRHDTIVYDDLSHASIRDGIRLSSSKSFSFKHNDLDDLRKKLDSASGKKIIAVESVYSMDGDFAPLDEIVQIAHETDASIVVDEAHATGIFGTNGEGRVHELGLQKAVFARIHTFGKALGMHGAVIAGTSVLRDYLINHARSFIYTTALPAHSLLGIQSAYRLLNEERSLIRVLHEKIGLLLAQIGHAKNRIPSASPIQAFVFPGNEQVKNVAAQLQRASLDVRPILSPTVPEGKERLRVCVHAFNTDEEIRRLCARLKKYCLF